MPDRYTQEQDSKVTPVRPTPKTFSMDKQLQQSRIRDAEIDRAFADKWYISKEVPRAIERMGVDRIWIHRETGRRIPVEYKSDERAHKTGNVFVEVESVEGEKKGWAYTSCARFIIYYVTGGEYAFVTRMDEIERRLTGWELNYPKRPAGWTIDKATGNRYRAVGICVPLMIYRAASECVVPVYSGDGPTVAKDNVIPLRSGSGVWQTAS
jgi:hypothetical protein